ncbi:MAG: DivIVA domain-containing protein [Eubacterium sp.]|nr:DivIVA domain-containing protein [Eubacterium sp.]
MMQPMDIRSQSFGTGLFGYKKSDVDQYVDTVYRAYDELFTENKKLREEKDKLNKVIEEQRVKMFKLENSAESVVDTTAVEAEKEKVVEAAADSFSAFDQEASKVAEADDNPFEDIILEEPKAEEPKADDKQEDSAASKFFQNAKDDVIGGDDDDVFVGEIEDNRKSSKVMIGDGEEEGADDFEFL